MRRLVCVLGTGSAAIQRAKAWACKLVPSRATSSDVRNALSLAVQQVTAQVLLSGPPPPSRLRLVGICSDRRIRVLILWSGAALIADQKVQPDGCSAQANLLVAQQLVDRYYELSVGDRRGVVLEKELCSSPHPFVDHQ